MGGPLDVVARAGGDVLRSEDHLLGDAPTEEHRELALQPLLGIGVPVLLRKARRDPECASARHDRDFVDGIEAGNPQAEHHVARLVIGGEPPLVLREDEALALGSEHDLVLRLLEVVHGDAVRVLAGGEQAASLQMFARSAPLIPACPAR
jgi:hypothetical protein